MLNIFERAARCKLRFVTSVGILMTEDIFHLPLILPNNRASLDSVARQISKELKEYGEESFVEVSPNLPKIELELKLEIVKHVIEVKKAQIAANEDLAKKAEKKHKLMEILAKKQDANLEGMSEEQILKELEALDA